MAYEVAFGFIFSGTSGNPYQDLRGRYAPCRVCIFLQLNLQVVKIVGYQINENVHLCGLVYGLTNVIEHWNHGTEVLGSSPR